jgi:HSP20 family protein
MSISLPSLLSQGISMIDGQVPSNNLSGIISEYLQTRGINMNEIWSPAIDLVENTENIYVYINIPGVKSDTINVDFFNNRIVVKGERAKPYVEDFTVRKNEIIYGKFERTVILPISVTSRESVTVNSKDGILVIKINKTNEETNRFSINVQ